MHFVVFDACRNELLLPEKSASKGLVPIPTPDGMIVGFASAFGATASDVGQGSGPYAKALAAELVKPGQSHLDLFQNVREAVARATGNKQRPYELNGLSSRVRLGPEAASVAAKDVIRPPAAPPPVTPPSTSADGAAQAWQLVMSSTDIPTLKAFLDEYGRNALYRRLAEVRIAALEQERAQKLAAAAALKQDAEQKRLAALKAEEDRLRAVDETKRKDEEEVARSKQLQRELNLVGGNGDGIDVYFLRDSTDLSPEAQQALTRLARQLQQLRPLYISVAGHSDEPGTSEYNEALGFDRARAVRDFLVRNGVNSRNVTIESYGKRLRAAECNDISCWSKNRRVKVIHSRT